MPRSAIIFLCFHTLLTAVYAWEHLPGPELEAALKSDDAAIVVAFVHPSDKKSEYLETEWFLALPEAKVPFVSVDCTANTATCVSHGVSSPTTVKLFKDGNPISTYNGPRRASALLAWADRVQRPVVSEVRAEILEDFKKADETVFIACLSVDDEAARATFTEVASRYREEFTFGMSAGDDVLAAEKINPPVVKCYKPLDGDTREFSRVLDVAALEGFVKEASRPVIGELLPHNHQRFLDRGWSMVYVFAATEAERAEIRKALNKMARSYYESLTIVTVDPLEFPELPAKLGLDSNVLPAGAVHQLSKDRIYPYPKGRGWTSSEVQSWGLDVWQGRIKPWTPPGVTTTYDDLGGRIKATQKISMRNMPGVKIKIAGRDEL